MLVHRWGAICANVIVQNVNQKIDMLSYYLNRHTIVKLSENEVNEGTNY